MVIPLTNKNVSKKTEKATNRKIDSIDSTCSSPINDDEILEFVFNPQCENICPDS